MQPIQGCFVPVGICTPFTSLFFCQRDSDPRYPHGNIVTVGDRVFHTCALADDLLLLLEEVDVTDNPERQDCIRGRNSWHEGRCDGSANEDQ